MVKFGRSKFKAAVILKCIRLYLSYSLSYREVEEIMREDKEEIDHSTINRWVLKFTLKILSRFQKTKLSVGKKWYMDETYVKVAGEWCYLFRAVDSDGRTIDFYFSKRRNKAAAYKFLKKAVKNNGLPVKVNIDKSGANTAGIELFNKRHNTNIEIDKIKYKNNIVEQDHRKIKRLTRSMGSFKKFTSAQITIAGIEMMNMLKKGQVYTGDLFSLQYEDDFYEIARQ
ncbi:MAG: IS6 family transposase [Bdellovibrionales bacterium]|nr:IS6 family transposase [Bdellovibrionales bacterium]